MKQKLLVALAGLALLLVIGACSPALTPSTFEVVLSGDQEVPPTGSTATGTANVTVVGNRMAIDGRWQGFDIAAPGAHVHGPANPGENAPILFELQYDNASRTFEGTFVLEQDDQNRMSQFLAGQLYINLHSAAFPDGEIRGQITPP